MDEQFDACFVKGNLLIGSGVNGPKVKLKLSTVLSEKVIKSQRIKGFVVHGYNKDVEIRLYQLGRVIPRPESALIWPHLQKISEKIMPLNKDVGVGLLIDLKCS